MSAVEGEGRVQALFVKAASGEKNLVLYDIENPKAFIQSDTTAEDYEFEEDD